MGAEIEMLQNVNILNLMVVGLSEVENRQIQKLIRNGEGTSRNYVLAQYDALENIDIVILDASDQNILAKWEQLLDTRECPPCVYVHDENSKYLRLFSKQEKNTATLLLRSRLPRLVHFLDNVALPHSISDVDQDAEGTQSEEFALAAG